MSRYRGPRIKVIKRLGELPGFTNKPFISKKTLKAEKAIIQGSQYSIRLQTKQKLRYHYGITEKKLIQYVQKAKKAKKSTGKILLQLLEMRLDNILYRANITTTIASARQLVNHGHIYINNKKIDIPSYSCKPGCKISFSDKLSKLNQIGSQKSQIPSHLFLNKDNSTIMVQNYLSDNEAGLKLNKLFVIEYYSRS